MDDGTSPWRGKQWELPKDLKDEPSLETVYKRLELPVTYEFPVDDEDFIEEVTMVGCTKTLPPNLFGDGSGEEKPLPPYEDIKLKIEEILDGYPLLYHDRREGDCDGHFEKRLISLMKLVHKRRGEEPHDDSPPLADYFPKGAKHPLTLTEMVI